ncbi:MAG: squalene/phytoene synthase family protein [Pseudobdellovibrionaceae bacterium]|jgi:phytoene synthase|nr:squalene/phytoene synthase family protein [Pseudobdellovibrionaceae bacterium]
MENNQLHLYTALKELDADRAFLSLFTPMSVRAAIQTLDLWNAEISRIREEVREPHMGMIRLQWWRDEICRICEGGRSVVHPVLAFLSDIIPAYGLSFKDFDRILSARELEFLGRSPEDAEELLSYIDGTQGGLMNIKEKILQTVQGERQDLTRLYSLTGLVRAVPFHGSFGYVMMPKLNISDIKPHSCQLLDVVRGLLDFQIPSKAGDKYSRAIWALSSLYLERIKDAGYDPFHIRPVPFKELRIWMNSF